MALTFSCLARKVSFHPLKRASFQYKMFAMIGRYWRGMKPKLSSTRVTISLTLARCPWLRQKWQMSVISLRRSSLLGVFSENRTKRTTMRRKRKINHLPCSFSRPMGREDSFYLKLTMSDEYIFD
jgi:hypothetical protein